MQQSPGQAHDMVVQVYEEQAEKFSLGDSLGVKLEDDKDIYEFIITGMQSPEGTNLVTLTAERSRVEEAEEEEA